jgi:hypothetical protein
LFDSFPIQNDLKLVVALSPQLSSFSLKWVIRKVQENHVGLQLNGTYQLLDYVDDINLLGDNIETIEKNIETLTDADMEVGIEGNVVKT